MGTGHAAQFHKTQIYARKYCGALQEPAPQPGPDAEQVADAGKAVRLNQPLTSNPEIDKWHFTFCIICIMAAPSGAWLPMGLSRRFQASSSRPPRLSRLTRSNGCWCSAAP